MVFYEKADEGILKECKKFIEENKEVTGQYQIYKEAVLKHMRLSRSLLESQKEFSEESMKRYSELMVLLSDFPESISEFQKWREEVKLVCDEEAGRVMKELEMIAKKNG